MTIFMKTVKYLDQLFNFHADYGKLNSDPKKGD